MPLGATMPGGCHYRSTQTLLGHLGVNQNRKERAAPLCEDEAIVTRCLFGREAEDMPIHRVFSFP